MTVPTWLSDSLTGTALAVAAYAVTRLIAAWSWNRRPHYDVDITHVLMGTAMAGMLSPALNVRPVGAWETVFGVVAAWFSWTTARCVLQYGLRASANR